ncbi:hypothetical protein SIID45300_01890 [Candidatus Magnetaquicoccaceae bacterium FCR-1]|uniref:Phosphate transport regulator n=1 Tax=Candidatus Magnetaquiglobus chichijimensis TaxID=3141448 RepID=A0ABQ0C9J4_9PROT
MPATSHALFGRIKALENRLDEFLDMLSESNIHFRAGITYFLEAGGNHAAVFQQKVKEIGGIQSRAENLKRHIEAELQEWILIPDLRADMVGLLHAQGNLIQQFGEHLQHFAIENPGFALELHKDIKLLGEQVALSVESCVMAARSLFRDPGSERDHIHMAKLHHEEAHKIAMRLKSTIFNADRGLEQKIHQRTFIDRIWHLALLGEQVCDALAVHAIKRAA